MPPVFRDYDQQALERQYTVTSADIRPLRDAREARVTALNEDVRATRPRLLDFVYGLHPRERIDLYPTEDDFAPLVVFIHGGYWKSRSKDQFAYLAPTFTDRGLNFATVGYPLAPEARLTDIVESCRRAIHWLLNYPSGLRFDPTRVHVIGHSAGGHLAAMMMATDWTRYALPAGTIKSATCVSGLYDLAPLRLVEQIRELCIDAGEVERLSPARLSPPVRGHLVVAVGDAESDEFKRHTAELASSWRKRGIRVANPAIPGRHHFDVLDALIDPTAALHKAAMAAIRAPRA